MAFRFARLANTTKRLSHILIFLLLSQVVLAPHATAAVRPLYDPALVTRNVAEPQSSVCDQVTSVPIEECLALVSIYTTTNGPAWINAGNWLNLSSALSPCDWHGVTCSNGHVSELALGANRLTGPFPVGLGRLPFLTRLNLSNNRLQGLVSEHVCALTDNLTAANLSYNALETRRSDIRACLTKLDPDWFRTQTIAPRNLQVTKIEDTAITISWNPVIYQGDNGYYTISYATSDDNVFTQHGQTANRLATSYRVDLLTPGTTYFIRIQSITPVHGNQPDQLISLPEQIIAVTSSSQRVLLSVYFPADNDLSPYIPGVQERLRAGSALNPSLQIVMFSDGNGSNDTQVVTIANGQITPTNAIAERWGKSELDSANVEVLAWFLTYARQAFPADREIVSLMGHGLPLTPEISWPTSTLSDAETLASPANNRIPTLPKGAEATPDDITNRGFLSTVSMGKALALATNNGANPFDILFFDQCFQGNFDTLYEVRNTATIFIASPNYAWLTAPYHEYVLMMAPNTSLLQITDSILARYQRNLNENHPNVIFAIRQSDLQTIATQLNDLSAALRSALRNGQRTAIHLAATQSKYVDTTQCGPDNLKLGQPDELLGLASFIRNLVDLFPVGDPAGVHLASQNLRDTLNNVRRSFRIGSPHIAPAEVWDYDNTLTVLAPLPPETPGNVAWRSSVYTTTAPLNVTWSAVPTMTVTVTSGFASVRDGTWDEFLAEWYSSPLQPTLGEWCHYTPPEINPEPEAEMLLLQSNTTNTAVNLTWAASTHEDTVQYIVYIQDSDDPSWVTAGIVPLGQENLTLTSLLPNANYQFQVVAKNAATTTLGQSNILNIVLQTNRKLFLPLAHS